MVDLAKEKEPVGKERVSVSPEMPTVESPRTQETPAEVSSWIEKIEKKFAKVPKAPGDTSDDTTVVNQPGSNQPPVKLPVTRQQMKVGQKSSPDLSISWLVTWAVKQIKKLARVGRTVEFEQEQATKEESK